MRFVAHRFCTNNRLRINIGGWANSLPSLLTSLNILQMTKHLCWVPPSEFSKGKERPLREILWSVLHETDGEESFPPFPAPIPEETRTLGGNGSSVRGHCMLAQFLPIPGAGWLKSKPVCWELGAFPFPSGFRGIGFLLFSYHGTILYVAQANSHNYMKTIH